MLLSLKRACAVLVCMGLFFSLASAVSDARLDSIRKEHDALHQDAEMANAETVESHSGFYELLHSASPESLHELLHEYLPERFQHGIYSSEHEALEAVHSDEPELAKELASMAKRQEDVGAENGKPAGDNSTTPAQTPTTSSQGLTTTSLTSSSTPPATTSSSSSPKPTTSTSDKPVTTSSTPTPTPSTSKAPSTTTPSSTAKATTPSEVPESTTEQKTITHGSKTTSSAVHHTLTTTLGNGGTTTITSTSWVAVVPTAAASAKKSPGLQNDASRQHGSSGSLLAGIGALVAGLLMA